MIVYIASPYTARDVPGKQGNTKFAEEIGKQVFQLGHVPLIPHRISSLWDYDTRFVQLTQDDWLNCFCLPFLIDVMQS
jgi:hypothetical protein